MHCDVLVFAAFWFSLLCYNVVFGVVFLSDFLVCLISLAAQEMMFQWCICNLYTNLLFDCLYSEIFFPCAIYCFWHLSSLFPPLGWSVVVLLTILVGLYLLMGA